MVIKLTESCGMGCSHCFSNCVPCDNKHMDLETFKKSLDLYDKFILRPPLILSGGEPTDNPNFVQLLDYYVSRYKNYPLIIEATIIATNGDYLSKHTDILDRFHQLKFQVVIDDRYYPKHVDEETLRKHSNVFIFNNVDYITPMGRALTNNLPSTRKAPSCYNIRSTMKYIKSYLSFGMLLSTTVSTITLNGYFCTPCIEYDGSIKLGESMLCPECSHIDKTLDDIGRDIIEFKCNKCDHILKNLTEEERKRIE